jgi:molybdate transport system regulatory protein
MYNVNSALGQFINQILSQVMTAKNIKIHIPYGKISAIGPGKADLLEAIERAGSISGAARVMGMSYKRAWDLVDTMNQCFREPLVITATGGSHGGGAQVTEFGYRVLRRYREIEAKANDHVEQDLRELSALLNPPAV